MYGPLPAIVTGVYGDGDTYVRLTVFGPDGNTELRDSVPYSEGRALATWSWPPRVS